MYQLRVKHLPCSLRHVEQRFIARAAPARIPSPPDGPLTRSAALAAPPSNPRPIRELGKRSPGAAPSDIHEAEMRRCSRLSCSHCLSGGRVGVHGEPRLAERGREVHQEREFPYEETDPLYFSDRALMLLRPFLGPGRSLDLADPPCSGCLNLPAPTWASLSYGVARAPPAGWRLRGHSLLADVVAGVAGSPGEAVPPWEPLSSPVTPGPAFLGQRACLIALCAVT